MVVVGVVVGRVVVVGVVVGRVVVVGVVGVVDRVVDCVVVVVVVAGVVGVSVVWGRVGMNMVVVSVWNLFSSNGVEVGRDHSVVGVSVKGVGVVVLGSRVVVVIVVVVVVVEAVVVVVGSVVPSVVLVGFSLFFCHFFSLLQKSGFTPFNSWL